MTVSSHSSLPADNGANLHFIDGSGSHSSYAAVARRGSIFLGIRFSGLTDGHQLGVPGRTYLHARMRSARDQALAVKLDLESGADNVIDLSAQQLALDEAWPAFAFEKAEVGAKGPLLGELASKLEFGSNWQPSSKLDYRMDVDLRPAVSRRHRRIALGLPVS